MKIRSCPICGSNKVLIVERGNAERDTLTKETWFISKTSYICRCMNNACSHETAEASTYERAIELWNKDIVDNLWQPISDFY